MKNNSNEQPNLQRSIIKDLNLTVVKAEPQVNGEDIAALIFGVDEYSDFKYRLFGWLSTSGEFYNHFTMFCSDIDLLKNELEHLGYNVSHSPSDS